MIKRSVATLSLLSLLFAGSTIASKHSSHSHSHKRHEHTQKMHDNSPALPADVKDLPPLANSDLCFHYVSNTLYILRPIMNRFYNYNATFKGDGVEFNICSPLVNLQESHPCYGSFACVSTNGS